MINCIVQANFNFGIAIDNLQRLGGMSNDVGAAINPNTLGIINVFAISGLIQIYPVNKFKKTSVIMISLLLLCGLLTASRTFVVCLLIMAVMFFIGQQGNPIKKVKFIISLFVFAIVITVVYALIFTENFRFFIGRFQTDDLFNGRDTIMFDYHRYITSNIWVMLFGVGLNNFGEKVINVYNISNAVPHNSIQEVVVAWGIPGLIMIGILIVMMILESTKYSGKKTILNYVPLIIILAKSMAGQLLTSGYTMLAFVLAYLSLCQNFSQSNDPKESRKLCL